MLFVMSVLNDSVDTIQNWLAKRREKVNYPLLTAPNSNINLIKISSLNMSYNCGNPTCLLCNLHSL